MSKVYFSIADDIVCFCIKEDGRQTDKFIHPGDEIIVNGEEISFPNSNATTETKFSEVEKYFKRYRTPDEYKEMKEFKKRAAIAAMQGFLSRETYGADLATLAKDSIAAAESLTDKMFE